MRSQRCVHISIYISRNRFYCLRVCVCVCWFHFNHVKRTKSTSKYTLNSVTKMVLVMITENKGMSLCALLSYCRINRGPRWRKNGKTTIIGNEHTPHHLSIRRAKRWVKFYAWSAIAVCVCVILGYSVILLFWPKNTTSHATTWHATPRHYRCLVLQFRK